MNEEVKSSVRLHWRERLELYVTIALVFAFFFWLFDYRVERLEYRMFQLFSYDARMDAVETWQCQRFNHACPD